MTVTREDPPPTVRIRRPEDLLALIPHELGRQPRDECVLFLPSGGHALFLVMDTPAADAPAQRVGTDLAEALAPVRGTGELVVVVHRHDAVDVTGAVLLELAAQWEAISAAAGLRVLSILLVGPERWWDVDGPERGHPLAAVEQSPVNAQMIAEGSAVEPPAPRDDPAWREPFGKRAEALRRSGWHEPDGCQGLPGHHGAAARPGGGTEPTSSAHGAGVRRPGPGSHAEDTFCAAGQEVEGAWALEIWDRSLRHVGQHRRDWVNAVLRLPDADLLTLLASLRDDTLRCCVYYAWLCGDTSRAQHALRGLRGATATLRGDPSRPDAPAEDVEEALRCVTAVAGEWDGPPHWESVECAQRVLQVLDGITHSEQWRGGHEALSPTQRDKVETAVTVGAALAQVEHFRGRGHTANRLLERCLAESAAVTPRSDGAVAETRRRLERQPVPWWCAEPSTGWPGRRWWSRQSTG